MKQRVVLALIGVMGIVSLACADVALSDDDMKKRIVDFVTLPSRLCGSALVDFRSEMRTRKLTNRAWFDGDTNRLARLVAELAQTNDTAVSAMMVRALCEYGTPAQLPFLYSCATNPAVGDRAVTAVLRIEGVTSNSVAMLQRYLSETNAVSRKEAYNRAVAAREFLDASRSQSVPSDLKETALCVAREFAANVNTSNSIVDEAIVGADESYRFSKRRLAVMRSAYSRCFNEFQTNYVSQVINELVAYPESALPD